MTIHPKPFYVFKADREKIVRHLPTFMNTCENGACGCTGDNIKSPDEFQVATLTAMKCIHDIYYASYHDSQKLAVLAAIKEEIASYERFIK